MKKQFVYALLFGALIFPTGTFISCNDDDVDELKSRITVVEGAIAELKEQLANALTTGASIVDFQENNGVYTLTLSNGSNIVIKAGSSSGGSNITVEINDNNAIITVDGTEYVLPLGSAVNSLIYSPEYADGIVHIGNNGATVNFLSTPAISANALKNATFDIAEAHELKTRGGNGLFKVNGEVNLEGDFLVIPVKALNVEAGKSYAVAVLMNVSGTSISSNYFTVKVSDDFTFEGEQIGGYEIKAAYSPVELVDGFNQITMNGLDLLKENVDFKDIFSTLPENAEFTIASKSQQPEGKAQEKWDILNKSLAKDGKWAFNERPGTSFNDNEDRPGFLFNILAEDVIKAKIYVVINDELAGVSFVGNLEGLCSNHMENPDVFAIGVNRYNIPVKLTGGSDNFDPRHGDTDKFLDAFQKYSIELGDEIIVYNNGETLEVSEFGKQFTKLSQGINWYNIQTSVIASSATEGGTGEIINGWDGISGEDMNNLGLKITNDGFIETTEAYLGWGLRVGMGLEFQYDYGTRSISQGCLAFIFFNRRISPDGVTNPDPR